MGARSAPFVKMWRHADTTITPGYCHTSYNSLLSQLLETRRLLDRTVEHVYDAGQFAVNRDTKSSARRHGHEYPVTRGVRHFIRFSRLSVVF